MLVKPSNNSKTIRYWYSEIYNTHQNNDKIRKVCTPVLLTIIQTCGLTNYFLHFSKYHANLGLSN